MISRRSQAKASQLWSMWCESHPAPRMTAVFLVVVLMLAALALTRPGHVTGAADLTPVISSPLVTAQAAA